MMGQKNPFFQASAKRVERMREVLMRELVDRAKTYRVLASENGTNEIVFHMGFGVEIPIDVDELAKVALGYLDAE
jgi:hypothetical protein